MADLSKFEQMLEYYLVSEDHDKAREIFHQLVVEKSREIYESLLSESFDDEEDDEYQFEADDEDSEDEAKGGEDDGEIGGDATDDFIDDVEAGDDSELDDVDSLDDDGSVEDQITDLKDALDELRAEFDQLMSEKEPGGMDDLGGEDDDLGDMDDLDGEDDEFGDMGDEDDTLPSKPGKDNFNISDSFMREYIEKVSAPKHGDDGDNTKSPVAGKNDMGGTTANIAKGGEHGGKGVKSGLLNPTPKEENFGNINVPGGKAGKTAYKKREPGHGPEKKGKGDHGDKSAPSPISGLKSRAK